MEHCNGMMYTVRSGDTLYSVSLKYGVPLALLLRVNPYVDVYNLQPGETICVPVKGSCHDYAAPYQGARSTDPVSGEETSAGRMTMDGMPADRMSGNYSSMDRMPGGETTMDRTSENRSMDRMPV